jgi:hypothetical protein
MKQTKFLIAIIGASLVILTGLAGQSNAGVSIGVGISVPPAYVVAAPPEVVVIPGTYVYAVPDPGVNILFYHGYWWRPYEGRWYRSARYNGSWAYVNNGRVPRSVIELPSDYHSHFADGRRISHEDLRRNWRGWERDRHWDRHEDRREFRDERREHGEGHRDR